MIEQWDKFKLSDIYVIGSLQRKDIIFKEIMVKIVKI